MKDTEPGSYWNENALTWTTPAREGYDIYRDHLNTPAFFDILPDISGLSGIDIGCGEGYNTRRLAQTGAKVKAVDISETFIVKAKEEENKSQLNIEMWLQALPRFLLMTIFSILPLHLCV